MEEIYYKGNIQEGSAEAKKDNKSLVFFVAADNCWRSLKWESENLTDGEIFPYLRENCIVFKLRAESAEASFLAMFCPEEKAPYLVVLKNGVMVRRLTHDTQDTAFISSLKSAISTPAAFRAATNASATPHPPSPSATATLAEGALSSLFVERRIRLEQQQNALAVAEREKKAAELKRRQDNLSPDRKKYVEEQTRRIAQDKAEKERILLRIENNRIERQVRELRKSEARTAVLTTPVQAVEQAEEKVAFNEALLSIRLLHGGLLKVKFLEGRLLSEVRKWVDENRSDGVDAYIFMQPPDRKFTAFDENKSLKELNLGKFTTLVLARR
ncbi:hypothetical protein L873DRAFT_1830477 [Choiromyces venosus 120613-1]|uniref:UBX domain-containing protein 2 n=1 Tax=Choiromyces venosus 120613-1 TaxID=1336337 RepID=A0A3N4J6Q3_9PEZI|nr:hypothetical protein L873DRAFT_1830477 [Choiromyces venosus 120613-1]